MLSIPYFQVFHIVSLPHLYVFFSYDTRELKFIQSYARAMSVNIS